MDNFVDTSSQIDQIYLWDLAGIAVFGVSGVSVGLERRMDVFGTFILVLVTGVEGGILRDITIGSIPVSWMNNLMYILTMVISAVLTVIFGRQFSEYWSKSLMLFGTIGLEVLAIIGIEEALRFGLSPTIAIILGTITGSFGGVIRDMLASKLPVLFHKEIYAITCIAGGTVYFLISGLMNHNLVVLVIVMVVISMHLLSLKYHWELPKF